MEQAYDKVRQHLSTRHQRQKEIYDKRIHGKPYSEGDTVWLFNPVVEKGQSKKFHHPWKVTLPCVKEDCDYRIESTTGKHTESIVHFNWLKLCNPGTRFHDYRSDGESCLTYDPPISCEHKTASHPVGENLELVDTNNATTVQP